MAPERIRIRHIIVSYHNSRWLDATGLGKFTILWLAIRDSWHLPNIIDDIKFVSSIRESVSRSNLKPEKMQHDFYFFIFTKKCAKKKEDCKVKGKHLSVQTSNVTNNQISHPPLIFKTSMESADKLESKI